MTWTKLLDLGVCFFERYMYLFFLSYFLRHRLDEKWVSVTVVSVLILGVFGINQFGIIDLNLVASSTLCIVSCQILLISPVRKRAFYVLLCCFIALCGEFVMTAIFYPYLGDEAIELSNDPKNLLVLVLSSELLTFMAIKVICHVSDNEKSISFPSLAPCFRCFPIACLVVYIGIAYSNISSLDPEFPTVILEIGRVLLLAANIALFVAYGRVVSMVNRVREYKLTGIKSHLENQHYLQIEEVNRKHSEIIYDMGNYSQAIETLALEENSEKIVDIIDFLNRHIVKAGEEHYCNHQILNVILDGKKREALTKKVDHNIYVELGFEKPEVEDVSLISIMSNLINDAIETANKRPNGFVDVQMYKANDGRFIIVKITSNYLEQPAEKDSEFTTRKQSPTMHGIGICNAKEIMEHYSKWANIEYGEGEPCITITFARRKVTDFSVFDTDFSKNVALVKIWCILSLCQERIDQREVL